MLTEEQELILRLARDAGGEILQDRLQSTFTEKGMNWDRTFEIVLFLMSDLGLLEPGQSGFAITQRGRLALEQIEDCRRQEEQRQRELKDERKHNWQVSLVCGIGGGALVIGLEKLIEWLRS